jgi:hypothetical protein
MASNQRPLPHNTAQCDCRREKRVVGDYRCCSKSTHEPGNQPQLAVCSGANVKQRLLVDRQCRGIPRGLVLEVANTIGNAQRLSDHLAHATIHSICDPLPQRHKDRLNYVLAGEQTPDNCDGQN